MARSKRTRRSLVILGAALLLGLGALLVGGIGPATAKTAPPPGLNFLLLPRPRPLPAFSFTDAEGHRLSLADFRGKLVLLNIWATWCPSCREEIGSLDRLQRKLGGPNFQVVALAVDEGGALIVESFLSKVRAHALKVYLDPTFTVPDRLDVFGLPTSFLVNAKGEEIGRITGATDWDRPAILDWLRHLLHSTGRVPQETILREAGRMKRARPLSLP